MVDIRLETFYQKMPRVINWANFFNNPANKKDLIKLVCSYFQTDELIRNRDESIWSTTND